MKKPTFFIAIILLLGLFGWKITLIYIVTGLLIAIISGWILGRLKMEKYVSDWAFQIKSNHTNVQSNNLTFTERINFGMVAVKDIVGKIRIYIIIGIAVGTGVHGYVSDGLLSHLMNKANWYSVPLAILLGGTNVL